MTIPKLDELTTEQFRQRLAGLIDPAEQVGLTEREVVRMVAIDFVACLPQIFGDDLDRLKMWDRIGSGIMSAYAKTVGDDVELFISEVCRHIQAGTAVAYCEDLAAILAKVSSWESEQREAWLSYLTTRLPIVLIGAKSEWEKYKAAKKGGVA